MSGENVVVVRSGYETFARGEMESLAAHFRKHCDPEFEYRSELAGESYTGVEGVLAFAAVYARRSRATRRRSRKSWTPASRSWSHRGSGAVAPEAAYPWSGESPSCGPSPTSEGQSEAQHSLSGQKRSKPSGCGSSGGDGHAGPQRSVPFSAPEHSAWAAQIDADVPDRRKVAFCEVFAATNAQIAA